MPKVDKTSGNTFEYIPGTRPVRQGHENSGINGWTDDSKNLLIRLQEDLNQDDYDMLAKLDIYPMEFKNVIFRMV